MASLAEIERIYDAYIDEVITVERNRKPFQGFLGFGKKTSEHPCHEQFVTALQNQLAELCRQGISSADARQVLAYIYRMPKEHPKPECAYWMMLAAHGTTFDLIGQLNRQDADALAQWYDENYIRRERLPVQKRILQALRG